MGTGAKKGKIGWREGGREGRIQGKETSHRGCPGGGKEGKWR